MKNEINVRTRRATSLLAILVLLFVCSSASSQPFYGGFAIGGTTSQIDGDHNNGFHKIGFTGGFFVGLELSDIFETQFEIKYIQKGAKSSAEDPYQFKIHLEYVELPLVASANLGFLNINGRNLDWIAFEAGASVDVLVKTNQRTLGGNEPSSRWKGLCLNGILGVKINLDGKKLQLGTRVITSINSAYAGNFSNYGTHRFGFFGAFNDVLEFVLYYRF
jgi:hypothetical protein